MASIAFRPSAINICVRKRTEGKLSFRMLEALDARDCDFGTEVTEN
jgi:hypothetical protein